MAGLEKSVGRFFFIAKAQRLFGYITHMKIPQKGSIKCLIISYSFSILHIGHSSAMFLQRLVLSALFLPLSVLYITVGVKNGKVMSPFRIIRQITMLKWNVGMRFIRKYGPRRRRWAYRRLYSGRWDCGSQKLDSIVYLCHGNMGIMPAASYVRFADTKIQR